MTKRRSHGGYRGPMPIDVQLRAQVVSLRRAGMMVNDICQRMDLHKASERAAVQQICDALPRKYQVGIDSTEPVRAGRRGASRMAL